LWLTIAIALPLVAQPPGRMQGGPPPNPKAAAPIDLVGYWVSIVTEDWRYRMVTPGPGDYQGVPMTPAALKIADAWDPAKEEASGDLCKSYGAPTILRVPEHLHITWQDDQTMKMETDAGKQTRVFSFRRLEGSRRPAHDPGRFDGHVGSTGRRPRPRGSGEWIEKVATSNLKAGFLRKNGVPYSDNTSLTEHYDLVKERNGDQLMVVTIVVTDPMYLRQPFIISSHFKKLGGDEGWNPTACSAKW